VAAHLIARTASSRVGVDCAGRPQGWPRQVRICWCLFL